MLRKMICFLVVAFGIAVLGVAVPAVRRAAFPLGLTGCGSPSCDTADDCSDINDDCCDGHCIDTNSDNNNCGGCDDGSGSFKCTDGDHCDQGECCGGSGNPCQ